MKKPFISTALSPLFIVVAPFCANAATDVIPFSGTVDAVCSIMVDTPGVMVVDVAHTELSTQQPGGAAGVATIETSNASFSVSAATPVSFTSAPAGGDNDVTFATFYNASGATTLSNIAGDTPSPLEQGITTVSVDLAATKASGTFPEGNYAADVVVTCE
ncbi:hypothetical protein [Chelativorans sp. Marseille-P2723]|uniref:hypothetical protein n=1 Tax=Chelativorans sp. Marseille-P2723 TaxID=2709133 RepID=UPI0015712AC4|nr:hypothetical protein [Chelativorans sp. Marseille-P2723]